jgi:hypothetical protein
MDKPKPSLLADKTKANADIGPATADCFGDTTVVFGPEFRMALSKNLILALASACAGLAPDPSQV